MRLTPWAALPASIACLAGSHFPIQSFEEFERSFAFHDLGISKVEDYSASEDNVKSRLYANSKSVEYGKVCFSVRATRAREGAGSPYFMTFLQCETLKETPGSGQTSTHAERMQVFKAFFRAFRPSDALAVKVLRIVDRLDLGGVDAVEKLDTKEGFQVNVVVRGGSTELQVIAD